MRHYLIKVSRPIPEGQIQVWYLDWSEICKAPLTTGMPLVELEAYWAKKHYGSLQAKDLPRHMALLDKKGVSKPGLCDLKSFIADNQAGPGGSTLTLEALIDLYCIQQYCVAIEEHRIKKGTKYKRNAS